MFDVAGAGGGVLDLGLGAGELDDFFGELVDGDAVIATDVVGAVDLGRGGVGEGGGDVFDEDEVAGLLAIAEDGDGLVDEGFANEDGNGGSVGAVGVLAGAEDVEEAEGGGIDAAFAAEHVEVVFAIEFGDGIGAFRLRDHVLGFGDGGVIAIDGGGAGEDEFFDTVVGGGFQDVEQAGDIDAGAFDGVLHGFRHGDHGGEVEDVVDAGHEGIDQGAIGDGAVHEGVIESREVFEVSGAEVVEHDDFRGEALEVLDKMRADETGTAGDE